MYLTSLNPVVGVEMGKTRPCLVVSPDLMHRFVNTVVIAPLTSSQANYPTRVPCRFAGKTGQVALDHIHAVDRGRLIKLLGRFDPQTSAAVVEAIQRLFA